MLMLRAATEGEWLERESSGLKGMEARGGRQLCGSGSSLRTFRLRWFRYMTVLT